MRLVMLTRKGNETGFAVSPHAFETEEAQDGSGKTWAEAGYKLAFFEDTREPYKAEPKPAAARDADNAERAARDPAPAPRGEEKKGG